MEGTSGGDLVRQARASAGGNETPEEWEHNFDEEEEEKVPNRGYVQGNSHGSRQ